MNNFCNNVVQSKYLIHMFTISVRIYIKKYDCRSSCCWLNTLNDSQISLNVDFDTITSLRDGEGGPWLESPPAEKIISIFIL